MHNCRYSPPQLLSSAPFSYWKALVLICTFAFLPELSGSSLKAMDMSLNSDHFHASGLVNADSLETNCVCPIFEQADDNPNCNYETACPSILERIQEWQIEMSPHPITESFSVFVNGESPPANLDVQIVDTENRIMMQAGKTNGEHVNLSVETLPPGQYLIQFSLKGQVIMMKRFVVYRN